MAVKRFHQRQGHYDSRTREGQVQPRELYKGAYLVRNWVTGCTYGLYASQAAVEQDFPFRAGCEVEVILVTSDNYYELRRQLQDNLDCWPE